MQFSGNPRNDNFVTTDYVPVSPLAAYAINYDYAILGVL